MGANHVENSIALIVDMAIQLFPTVRQLLQWAMPLKPTKGSHSSWNSLHWLIWRLSKKVWDPWFYPFFKIKKKKQSLKRPPKKLLKKQKKKGKPPLAKEGEKRK